MLNMRKIYTILKTRLPFAPKQQIEIRQRYVVLQHVARLLDIRMTLLITVV